MTNSTAERSIESVVPIAVRVANSTKRDGKVYFLATNPGIATLSARNKGFSVVDAYQTSLEALPKNSRLEEALRSSRMPHEEGELPRSYYIG